MYPCVLELAFIVVVVAKGTAGFTETSLGRDTVPLLEDDQLDVVDVVVRGRHVVGIGHREAGVRNRTSDAQVEPTVDTRAVAPLPRDPELLEATPRR
jgi:hypothetical protein